MRVVTCALFVAVNAGAALGLHALPAEAQWVRTHEQFYFPASHNWAFRHNYRVADRLFNAFDNAHNILGETLWTSGQDASVEQLERDEFNFIVNDLLVHPPRLPLVEEAIGPSYAKLVPEARLMFEWAHLLHRQLYDVYADERVKDKQAAAAELLRYYKSRPDLAFSTRPKSMVLMEGQPYSLAFRQKYPKFNGLIWAYHWLQVGLYEPLIQARTEDERQTGVTADVARFWSMLEDAPNNMPAMMPMTAAVAPEFTRRHPEAAAVFDNLHAMHDIISDILVSPVIPREKKREAILAALASYRDDTTEVMTLEEWKSMALEMGLQNMGGPATAILPPPPGGTPMEGMQHGANEEPGAGGMQHGAGGEMPGMTPDLQEKSRGEPPPQPRPKTPVKKPMDEESGHAGHEPE
jgi:hypothetical protein